MQWPPNYIKVYQKRARLVKAFSDPKILLGAKEYYKNDPLDFIQTWCDTYDPRNAGTDRSMRMPLVLFPKQIELVDFLHKLYLKQGDGLVEKSRDMGATWVACGFSVWMLLFSDGAAVGWGSRKQELVDQLGDPKSIFEKIRNIIDCLPKCFYPKGFERKKHMTYMRVINPETGATIIGETGDNIGRGGRTSMYFKDESAHYVRAENIEAALGANTKIQVDISSVYGIGTVFHTSRENGIEWDGENVAKDRSNVFIMDWSDHPDKTQEWYENEKLRYANKGLPHKFAQEVDRSYAASVEGIIIPPEWVVSAIDAHKKINVNDTGAYIGALDVADGGSDKNAFAIRKGIMLEDVFEWGERDTGLTARRAIDYASDKKNIQIQYDCIGVGSGVKAETNRLKDEKIMPRGMRFVPWDAGSSPLNKDKPVIRGDKDSPLNKDFYKNLKAQGWWELRRRFEKTHKHITEGVEYPVDEMISLCSNMKNIRSLQKELSQPTSGQSSNMKLIVNKTPDGTRSPNLADAVMMAYWPVNKNNYTLDNLYG